MKIDFKMYNVLSGNFNENDILFSLTINSKI